MPAVKAALAVNICIVENGCPSKDMFLVVLDERTDGSRDAKVKVSRTFADIEDENAFKKLLLIVSQLNEGC